ncbi:hypothetical protein D3C75_1005540 [compost metagenome]
MWLSVFVFFNTTIQSNQVVNILNRYRNCIVWDIFNVFYIKSLVNEFVCITVVKMFSLGYKKIYSIG